MMRLILILLFLPVFASAQMGMLLASETAAAPTAQQPKIWLIAEDVDGDGDSGNNPSSGTEITTWADVSGNGWDFTNNSATTKPVYIPSAKNGLAAIRFTDDGMKSGAISDFHNVKNYTIMYAAKVSNTSTNYIYCLQTSANSYTMLDWIQSGTNYTMYRLPGSPASALITSATAVDTAFIAQYNWENNTAYSYVRTASTDKSSTTLSHSTTGNHINFVLGSFNPTLGHLDGDIYEVLIFSPHLSAADETYWEDYLYDKYGF